MRNRDEKRKFWEWPVAKFMNIWYYYGIVYLGYEIRGWENIPEKDEGAIFVLYHAAAPIDAGFFMSTVFFKMNHKRMFTIVDRVALSMPGYQTFAEAMEMTSGTVDGCIDLIKSNNLIALYPGGKKEQALSDSISYKLYWPERAGFAKIAFATKTVKRAK